MYKYKRLEKIYDDAMVEFYGKYQKGSDIEHLKILKNLSIKQLEKFSKNIFHQKVCHLEEKDCSYIVSIPIEPIKEINNLINLIVEALVEYFILYLIEFLEKENIKIKIRKKENIFSILNSKGDKKFVTYTTKTIEIHKTDFPKTDFFRNILRNN